MGWGGKRPNSGRKKKYTQCPFDGGAEEFLRAVVRGEVPADPVKVQAAKCLIAYEKSRVRAKPEARTARELRRSMEQEKEKGILEDFERRAEEIRARHKAKEVGK